MTRVAVCDFCNRTMPTKLIEDESNPEDFIVTTELCRTKTWDTKKLFPHLCQNCADKLDFVYGVARRQILKEIDISARNSVINVKRRTELGSKG